MADAKGEEKPNVNAKNLIASFEKGEVTQNSIKHEATEKPLARPGAAKKLQQVYEDKSKPDPAPPITKHAATKNLKASVTSSQSETKVSKNVFIVFVHWERKSFNGALLDTAVKSLEKCGHKVTVSDLYAMKWNPVPSQGDIKGEPDNKELFSYLHETGVATKNGTLAQDIVEEHKKMQAADLVIFQFPMNWYSYPAMLKGWFDRCITNGFAFNTEKGELFDRGLMKGKKAVLSFTTGGLSTAYNNCGINGDMNVFLWPMHLGVRFAGFDVLPPQISYNVSHTSNEERVNHLTSWEQRLQNIFSEEPLKFVPLANFSMEKGLILDEDNPLRKEAKEGFGITVGQNFGRAIPPNSMTSGPKL